MIYNGKEYEKVERDYSCNFCEIGTEEKCNFDDCECENKEVYKLKKTMEFKVGDIVRVYGKQTVITFTGQEGEVKKVRGNSLFVDFKKEFNDSLHSGSGIIGSNTGYFISLSTVKVELKPINEYIAEDGTIYEFSEFSLIDLFKKKPQCKEWNGEFIELLKEVYTDNTPVVTHRIDIKGGNSMENLTWVDPKENKPCIYKTLTKPKNLKWLCDNGFVKVKERLYKLLDYSSLHDVNLNRVQGMNVFHNGIFPCCDLPKPIIRIIEEGLRIPYINVVGDTDYLDCMIEYKGERYYTKKKYIKEV